MHIAKDHLYHGAALTQIAEHRPFKAINALELDGKRLGCAFRINDKIGIYIKYDAVGPKGIRYPEFKFTFSAKNLSEIRGLKDAGVTPLFIVLVCLKAEEICVITEDFFWELINVRQSEKYFAERQHQILVQEFERKWFNVYINKPRKKGVPLGSKKIPRRDFPRRIFE